VGVGDAKWIVHSNLDPGVRAATERLWADAIDAVEEADRPPVEGDRAPLIPSLGWMPAMPRLARRRCVEA